MERIAITGMGVISTAGFNLDDFWNTLVSGTITYNEIEEYCDNKNFRVKIGAKIDDESWSGRVDSEYLRRFGRASNYSIATSLAALENAGLERSDLPAKRTAVVMSTTMGEIQVEEQINYIKHHEGVESVPRDLLGQYRTDGIITAMSTALGVSGPMYMVPAACAGGNYAVGLGKRLIELGDADVVIAGGVDVFSRVAFIGFQRLLSLTPDLCKPFDKKRRGIVIGEGCGIVVMERMSSALARGARVYGELLGVGLTSDRYSMISPHPEGDGAIRAIRAAIEEAGISPEDIDYVSAHGTGTVANDKMEVKALEEIFGKGKVPPTSSIKSMIGHPMGAAGALELIASLLMMERHEIIPTANYSEPDPECDIDCVPNKSRSADLNHVLSNSFGFGGQSSSIIVKKG